MHTFLWIFVHSFKSVLYLLIMNYTIKKDIIWDKTLNRLWLISFHRKLFKFLKTFFHARVIIWYDADNEWWREDKRMVAEALSRFLRLRGICRRIWPWPISIQIVFLFLVVLPKIKLCHWNSQNRYKITQRINTKK